MVETACHLDREVSTSIFQHDTPCHDAPLDQVWLQKFELFRRYRPDKIWPDGLTDTPIYGQTENAIYRP